MGKKNKWKQKSRSSHVRTTEEKLIGSLRDLKIGTMDHLNFLHRLKRDLMKVRPSKRVSSYTKKLREGC